MDVPFWNTENEQRGKWCKLINQWLRFYKRIATTNINLTNYLLVLAPISHTDVT